MDGADVPLISVDSVLDGKLYIGNLAAGFSKDLHAQLNITHVLSVCPENPSSDADAVTHLCIPIQDTEFDDLLIHLPRTCQFIQSALDNHGVVLVHCLMGVSRSATVICAYLMQSQRIDARAALQVLRKRRSMVHPNYGFRKQLHTFAECRFKPSDSHPDYIAWMRRQKRDVTKYLNTISDTVPVVLDQLYLTRCLSPLSLSNA
ncbi:phosphatases II [Coniophora puteana RWD-64-598 SS2]|uniref:Phosphatases II n=1 Tax=Coniophora puteana (strain RWD-64-598) TaxID=741705 RepID=A0A5M3MBV0_CONPW|nr:phosphatases II [Coniophora puteana RWD-64-598 SS2]EIW76527.1 phosphatases II [Coniophora puteana RWD-64-598 SS2]